MRKDVYHNFPKSIYARVNIRNPTWFGTPLADFQFRIVINHTLATLLHLLYRTGHSSRYWQCSALLNIADRTRICVSTRYGRKTYRIITSKSWKDKKNFKNKASGIVRIKILESRKRVAGIWGLKEIFKISTILIRRKRAEWKY